MTLLYSLFLVFLLLIQAESADPPPYSCSNNGNHANASTEISKNTQILLRELVSDTIRNGFVTTSYGEKHAKLYGLAQCRRDVSHKDCSSCIKYAAETVRKFCPKGSDVRIWPDDCFLRYNTDNFFGELDTTGWYMYNVESVENVTDVRRFNRKLGNLMDKITSKAVKPAKKGMGKGKRKISDFLTLYALVQCTRDLKAMDCAECLATGIGHFPKYCNSKRGCRVLYGSCYIRYELYPFFFPLDNKKGASVRSSGNYERVVAVKH